MPESNCLESLKKVLNKQDTSTQYYANAAPASKQHWINTGLMSTG